MTKKYLGLLCLVAVVTAVFSLFPELAMAQNYGGSGFESRVNSLTNSLITVILPAVSILGLIYAAILAATGDEGAKRRMVLVVIASMVGFLAPMIIRWFQSAAGG
ncbi:MAG: TrbC/VirB2 family protein [Halobacteriovoraceae bacterium]|nr:TrbC/VirB2 family protein [Halobacteriovoraceae bacterium]MCB9093435.1 TrbC/VirB2 family protein [Halobacteriovoraceae bacterium]